MAFITQDSPLGARSNFAKIMTLLRDFLAGNPRYPKNLSDAAARDIGLSAHDLELLRYELPSQSSDKPLI